MIDAAKVVCWEEMSSWFITINVLSNIPKCHHFWLHWLFGNYFKFHFSKMMSLDHTNYSSRSCLSSSGLVSRWWIVCGAIITASCLWQTSGRVTEELRRVKWVIFTTYLAVFLLFLLLKYRTVRMGCRIKICKLIHVNMTHWAGQDWHCKQP